MSPFPQIESTRQMTDGGGATVRRQLYTAFGEPIQTSGSPNTRYQYAGAFGYERVTPPGEPAPLPFLHVGARWYDQTTGRFLQRDPIGLSGGLNFYAYAHDNPNQTIDPSGLDDCYTSAIVDSVGAAGTFGGLIAAIVGTPVIGTVCTVIGVPCACYSLYQRFSGPVDAPPPLPPPELPSDPITPYDLVAFGFGTFTTQIHGYPLVLRHIPHPPDEFYPAPPFLMWPMQVRR